MITEKVFEILGEGGEIYHAIDQNRT